MERQRRNSNDGTGSGVVYGYNMITLTPVADTSALPSRNLGYASIMTCAEDGTIQVELLYQGTGVWVLMPVAAYKDNIWNIIAVGTGGSVDLANVTLQWQ